MKKKRILLVEPEFPIPTKSKNHKNFLPIGLLKLASYYGEKGHKIKLVRGNIKKKEIKFNPDKIMITSLFTYWSKYVKDSVQYYKSIFPKARISVGGIYASLMPKHCKKYTGCDNVFTRLHTSAEKCKPAYDLIFNPSPPYQIIHASRGCIRKCKFCGTWKLEPTFIPKKSIKNEIKSNKLIFYDNNLLANPYIKNILKEVSGNKFNGKPIICESQSGFDGRLLDLETVKLLKKARFIYPRIAWDGSYSEFKNIKKQIDLLCKAGYNRKDIFMFMLSNFSISYEEMIKKLKKCKTWGIQIADCRYRPLNQTFDNYNPQSKKGQTEKDYYIHKKGGWTDKKVRSFRREVRRQNIGIRYGKGVYNHELATTYSNLKRACKKAGIKKIPKLYEFKRNKKLRQRIERKIKLSRK